MTKVPSAVVRLFYLDWLRVLAILGVFLFHNARLFDAHSTWHVKDVATNEAATFMVGFMGQWIMPLFFLISGPGPITPCGHAPLPNTFRIAPAIAGTADFRYAGHRGAPGLLPGPF